MYSACRSDLVRQLRAKSTRRTPNPRGHRLQRAPEELASARLLTRTRRNDARLVVPPCPPGIGTAARDQPGIMGVRVAKEGGEPPHGGS